MHRSSVLFLGSLGSLAVAIAVGVYLFMLGVAADGSTDNVSLSLWAIIAGGLALGAAIAFFLGGATRRARRRDGKS